MRISDWSSDVCSSDLATDVDDLACVLGQWNELGWADEAELWAMPPYQCFETDDVLAARVDDGLKLQLELVARQCPAQGRLQPQALLCQGMQRRFEMAMFAAADVLGAV